MDDTTTNTYSEQDAMELLQRTYFDSIDEGRLEDAVSAMHPDVEWIHMQVRWYDGYDREEMKERGMDYFTSRNELLEFLEWRVKDGVVHTIDELVVSGHKGAFLARTIDGEYEFPFIGWFEIADDMIIKYIAVPRSIPT